MHFGSNRALMTAEQVHAAFCRLFRNDIVGKEWGSVFILVTSFAQNRALHAPQRHRFVPQVSWMDGEGVATEL